MKNKNILLGVAAVGGVFWYLSWKKEQEWKALANDLLPGSVNGLGNIFNQTKIMRRSTPRITRYTPPTRPQFSTPRFFR